MFRRNTKSVPEAPEIRFQPSQAREMQRQRQQSKRYEFKKYGEYGSGPQPSHYYPGLTPKDVILHSKEKPLAPGYPRPLRDRELGRVYGLMQQWNRFRSEGRLPQNEELLLVLDNLFQAACRYEQCVGPDSQKILASIIKLIDAMGNLIQNKNYDERMQVLIHHALLYQKTASVVYPNIPVFEDVVNSVGGIMGMLVTNREFRGLAFEMWQLYRELSGQRESKYRIQYTGQENRRIRREPAETIWLDGGLVQEMGFEGPSGPSGRVVLEPREEYEYHEEYPAAAREERYARFAEEEYEHAEELPAPRAEYYEAEREYPASTRVFHEEPGGWARFGGDASEFALPTRGTTPHRPTMESFAEIPRRHKAVPIWNEPVLETPISMQRPLTNEMVEAPGIGEKDYADMLLQTIPPDRLYRLMERLRQVLLQVSQMPQLQESLKLLTNVIFDLGSVRTRGPGRTLLDDDANRLEMFKDIQCVLERICNYPLDPLIECVDELQMRYGENFQLRDYMEEVQQYFSRAIQNQQYLTGVDFVPKGIGLLKRGREVFGVRNADVFNALVENLNQLGAGLMHDPDLNNLSNALQEVFSSIFVDPRTGKMRLNQQFVNDIRDIYLPILMEAVRYIPMPRLEIHDANYDMAFDNIVLSLDNILPNLMEVKLTNDVQISPRPELPTTYYTAVLSINMYQIQADLQEVEFVFSKKSFPPFHDMGQADIFLGGDGLSIEVQVAIDVNLPHTTMIPLEITSTIDKLRINLHESRHDRLYKLFGGTMTAAIKKRLERAIEDRIYGWVRSLDSQLTNIKQQRMGSEGGSSGWSHADLIKSLQNLLRK